MTHEEIIQWAEELQQQADEQYTTAARLQTEVLRLRSSIISHMTLEIAQRSALPASSMGVALATSQLGRTLG